MTTSIPIAKYIRLFGSRTVPFCNPAEAYHGHGEQYHREVRGEGKGKEPGQGEAHPRRQRIRLGMPVGIVPDEGLEYGGSHLEYQRDYPYLGEGQPEIVFQDRVHCRYHRLYHVVQQMAEPYRKQYCVRRPGLDMRMSFQSFQYAHFPESVLSITGFMIDSIISYPSPVGCTPSAEYFSGSPLRASFMTEW